MAFSLPPKLEEKYRALATREVRFLNSILIPGGLIFIAVAWFGGDSLIRHNLIILEGMGFLFLASFLAAGIHIMRHREQRAIALGLVCPRCGKAIYVGRNHSLQVCGECPRCKAFIIEELQEKYGDSPVPN